jgi:hypothetical protein
MNTLDIQATEKDGFDRFKIRSPHEREIRSGIVVACCSTFSLSSAPLSELPVRETFFRGRVCREPFFLTAQSLRDLSSGASFSQTSFLSTTPLGELPVGGMFFRRRVCRVLFSHGVVSARPIFSKQFPRWERMTNEDVGGLNMDSFLSGKWLR